MDKDFIHGILQLIELARSGVIFEIPHSNTRPTMLARSNDCSVLLVNIDEA